MGVKIFRYDKPFQLDSGAVLPGYHLAYTTMGQLNAAADNVVWIFHALTASGNPAEWWPGLVGEGRLFSPERYFIVCVNMPGSCYGSISPLDADPATGQPWYHRFPFFTPADMARAYQPLRDALGIRQVYAGIGGSMGGQQLLEWAVQEPDFFQHIIPMATNAQHSPWGIAFNAAQRMAIEADSSWQQQHPAAGISGLKAARSMALLSYRHYQAYGATQAEAAGAPLEQFRAESYQRYQGEKLAARFNAFSYYFLSRGMDAHNLGRGRSSAAEALQQIKARTLVIGIDTDMLFPVEEQAFIAQHIPGSVFTTISSMYGHDGFLVEYERIAGCITAFLPASATADTGSKKQALQQQAIINRTEN